MDADTLNFFLPIVTKGASAAILAVAAFLWIGRARLRRQWRKMAADAAKVQTRGGKPDFETLPKRKKHFSFFTLD